MPALDINDSGVPAVGVFASLLHELLDEAAAAKQTTTIEPPLNKADLSNLSQRVSSALPFVSEANKDDAAKTRRNAIVETAARDLFSNIIATVSIDSPDFVKIWNLMDILSILSDDGWCDPALFFWLAEELLESQTIAGCRKIFDFLESRRERITAKHFKGKQLVLLRTCNELLRRLSRAEDTSFCGRVFIFLFQSFPLGDRSSVNLRGEYHVENVTSYDTATTEDDSQMDVDAPNAQQHAPAERKGSSRATQAGSKDTDKPLEPEALYPLFWSLQESFSQPLKLFDTAHFSKFKHNLEATLKTFQAIKGDDGRPAKAAESSKGSLKRKRSGTEDDLPEAFNPKYLTSKDLFKLEISDLSFRRNVLVQALIIIDFLLTLTPQFKEKLSSVTGGNRSVTYSEQLSEDDIQWTNKMKGTISNYIKASHLDGPYFYRMVETVLARDKNWVFWKIESCPPIKRDPTSAATFIEARTSAQRMTTSKRLRPVPLGSVSLDFLRNEDENAAMANLKSEDRYKLPELDDFKRKIADDDFEISMPTNAETKAAALAGKASKSWRALRIAGRFRLAAFDKIDDPKKINAVFEELKEGDEDEEDEEPAASEESMPTNREPIIVSGPEGVGKSSIIQKLLDEHKGVFTLAVRHTTREAREGEVDAKDFHFVKALEFNQLRDGDRLIEYGTRDKADYGTSSKVIEAITESGKVPIIELDLEAAQCAKDMDFSARFILIKPSSNEVLGERLERSGKDAAVIQKILEQLPAAYDESKIDDLFDTTISSDSLDEAVKAVSGYIYERPGDIAEGDDVPNGDGKGDSRGTGDDGDKEMA